MMFLLLLDHPLGDFNWIRWTIHPSTVVGLVALSGLYLWQARHENAENPLSPLRRLSFFSALFVVFVSLNGPLHELSDTYLFSAHMVQHLLLTMLFPPLLIVGVPGWMLRPILGNTKLFAVARFLTKPI